MTITITNDGDLDMYPILKMAGVFTNPTFTNVTTDQSVAFVLELTGRTILQSATQIRIPWSDFFTPTQGSIAMRVTASHNSSAHATGNAVIFDVRDDANNRLTLSYDYATQEFWFERLNAGASDKVTVAATFANGQSVELVVAWTATGVQLSVDGSGFTTVAGTDIPTLASVYADFGQDLGTRSMGTILWVSFMAGTLTSADLTRISAFAVGANKPSMLSNWGDDADIRGFWNGTSGSVSTQILIVDNDARTATVIALGQTVSVMPFRTNESVSWPLIPGDNEISFEVGGSSGDLNVDLIKETWLLGV